MMTFAKSGRRIPDGRYRGRWSGNRASLDTGENSYWLKTEKSVITNIGNRENCDVIVTNGGIVIFLDNS